jgi:hypothetical protein
MVLCSDNFRLEKIVPDGPDELGKNAHYLDQEVRIATQITLRQITAVIANPIQVA